MKITREAIKASLRQIEEYYDYSNADEDYHILVKLDTVTDLIEGLVKATKDRYNTGEKEIPKKPFFYDTKFRKVGEKYIDIQPQYRCSRCNNSLWLEDKFKRCTNCGQALTWENCKYNGYLERWE